MPYFAVLIGAAQHCHLRIIIKHLGNINAVHIRIQQIVPYIQPVQVRQSTQHRNVPDVITVKRKRLQIRQSGNGRNIADSITAQM